MATYYWVGGAGTWDATSTTHWSLSSGGAGGAGVPTLADDVTVNGVSGSLGDVITIGSGAVAKTLTYSGSIMDFLGSGTVLALYGSLSLNSALPSGLFAVDDLEMHVKTTTGTTIASVSPLKNVTAINAVSPTGQSTLTLGNILTCATFTSFNASVNAALPSFTLNCARCFLEGSASGYARTFGTFGSTIAVNATPTVSSTTAFSSVWDDSPAAFYGLTVTVKNAAGTAYVTSNLQASYATSFNLVVDNSNVTVSEIYGGVDNLTIANSGTLLAASFPVFGNVTINSGCTMGSQGSTRIITLQKKTATPYVARTVQASAGSLWKTVGLRNSITAGTDTVSVSGNIGSSGYSAYEFRPGDASVSSSTVYADTVALVTGVTFASTVINSTLSFTIALGATVNGSYTLNSYGLVSTNSVAVPTLNAYNGTTIGASLTVTTLAMLGTAGLSVASIQVKAGATITVLGTYTLQGVSGIERVELSSYSPATSPFTISKASGTVNASFATISYSNATGGARFLALVNDGCVNGGNNTGWIFLAGAGSFFTFM